MEIKRYEKQKPNVKNELLTDDEYTFSVLSRIMQGECRLTLTDNKTFIICHSDNLNVISSVNSCH